MLKLFYRDRKERTVKELWASVVEEVGKASMARNFRLNTVFLKRFYVKILTTIFAKEAIKMNEYILELEM